MELGERELEKIGEYVKSHLPQWMAETGMSGESGAAGAEKFSQAEGKSAAALHKRELDILERIVRVEDELKNLREVMEERFGKMDERFIKIDERFETMQNQMNRRFEAQQNLIEERFGKMDERFIKIDERFETMQNQMNRRFEAQQNLMEERFNAQRELMEERFEHIEKRTAFIQWGIGIGFTAIAVLMGVLNYIG